MMRVIVTVLAGFLIGSGGCGGDDDDDGSGDPDGGGGPGTDAATAPLTVHVTGAGEGVVTSEPAGLECATADDTCTADIPQGDVELTATPADGYVFRGWIGGGCGFSRTCTVSLDGEVEVSAAFVPVAYAGNGALDGNNAVLAGGATNVWTARTDGEGAAFVTALTAAAGSTLREKWSPDGTRLLFASNRAIAGGDALEGNATNIFIVDADGTHLTPVTALTVSGAQSGDPEWSPDGSRITYRSNRALDGDDALVGCYNVWVSDPDGSNATPLTSTTDPSILTNVPRWSPDGVRIAYQSTRALNGDDAVDPGGDLNLWIVTTDGSDDHPLTELTAAGAGPPTWSPDGTRLVYGSARSLDGEDASGGGVNLWVIDVTTADTTPITSFATSGPAPIYPDWSPDGTHIYYLSTGALDGSDAGISARNVWVVDADGAGRAPLTTYENAVLAVEVHATPDGSAVFFVSNADPDGDDASIGNDNIWGVGADGASLQPVTRYDVASYVTFDAGGF